MQFVDNTEEIWSYCGEPNHYKTAFMVIGPITRTTQLATGKPASSYNIAQMNKSSFNSKAFGRTAEVKV